MAPRAQKALELLAQICDALPETDEGTQMGSVGVAHGQTQLLVAVRLRQRSHGSFWVGIERQGPLEMDPRFKIPRISGTKAGLPLDAVEGRDERELREFLAREFSPFRNDGARSRNSIVLTRCLRPRRCFLRHVPHWRQFDRLPLRDGVRVRSGRVSRPGVDAPFNHLLRTGRQS